MRINYLDHFKVLALVLMTFFHYKFVSFIYTGNSLTYTDNSIGFVARFLFLMLFGVHYKSYLTKFSHKISKLILTSVIITIASFVFDSPNTIVFGVIHFFTLCACVFRYFPRLIYALGFISTVFLFVELPDLSHNWFLIFGLTTPNFSSYDYFPFLPFFSYVFCGVLYRDYIIDKQIFTWDLPKNPCIQFLAQHSLAFYLLHVPIILLVHYMMM